MDRPAGATANDTDIRGLTADSRMAGPGYLFAALDGAAADGRAFIADAVKRGARAILAPPGTTLPPGLASPSGDPVVLIEDPAPRRRLAQMAARFYGVQPEIACAITGTNGKTSMAWFTRQIWQALGHKAASIGTLGPIGADNAPLDLPGAGLTTPDAVALHAALAGLAKTGTSHLVIEASSHGLDQCRLDGVRLTAAAFANLTRDHLDYHVNEAAYRAAKFRLFDTLLPAGGAAIINADSREAASLTEICRAHGHRILTYGKGGADIRLERLSPRPAGQGLTITVHGVRRELSLPLIGDFQASNALGALALVIGAGADPDRATDTLAKLNGVPGRLENVAAGPGGAPIIVDYAHTPDALESVLRAVRPHVPGRLHLVFGCGGDRDTGKRPEMGRIAAEGADRITVTDDNPRTEDPAAIRAAILAACPGAVEIGARDVAIEAAIGALKEGDALIIAGKGHETGQIIGTETRPFNDAEIARAVAGASRTGGTP